VQITLVDRHNHRHVGLLCYADALLRLRSNALKIRNLVEKGFGESAVGGGGTFCCCDDQNDHVRDRGAVLAHGVKRLVACAMSDTLQNPSLKTTELKWSIAGQAAKI
jgi:hypothetical protein